MLKAIFRFAFAVLIACAPAGTAKKTSGSPPSVGVTVGSVTYACTPNVGGGTSPTPPPHGTGGNRGAGGNAATGGTPPASTGGNVSATGGNAPVPGTNCPVVEFPDTPLPLAMGKELVRHKLPERHHRRHGRALETTGITECSGGALPLVKTPLNQVDGSCTGAAGVGMISSPPFKTSTHFNIADSLLAYQGGTCEDNGCVVPCTCNSCPAGYCPATHNNDVGSDGSSVAKWMTAQGWMPGYTTADTIPALLAGLSSGKTCTIGIDVLDSMWTPSVTTGEIQVDLGTPFQGGHDLHAVLVDIPKRRVWVHNSWGPWGWCFKKFMTANSSKDGTGCGYGWIGVDNLPLLHFDGDCPIGPSTKKKP